MTPASSSSSILLSFTVLMLGTLMLRLSGDSRFALLASVIVLSMGLGATAMSVLGGVRLPRTGAGRSPAGPGPASQDVPVSARPERRSAETRADNADVKALSRLLDSFNIWWEAREEGDLWPGFDRWLRDVLHELGGAERLRCFHVEGEPAGGDPTEPAHRLFSLTDDLDDPVALGGDNRRLAEEVIRSGRMRVRKCRPAAQGCVSNAADALRTPDTENRPPGTIEAPYWLLAIRECGRTCGLLAVVEFSSTQWHNEAFLEAAGRIIELCWRHVRQECDLRAARRTDRASGVLNRADLTEQAGRALDEARHDDEPVVLMALAIEGLRRLDDGRQWELQNWLMQQIGCTLRRRLRSDDIVGRFSEDRFVILMRRLDLSLGELIARKVLASVTQVLGSGDPALDSSVRVRCGLSAFNPAESRRSRRNENTPGDDGGRTGGFEGLLGRACDALQRARGNQVDLAMDPVCAPAGPVAVGAAG